MICDINKYFLLLITSLNILNFRFIMSVIYHSIEVFICTLFTPLWPDHVHEISSLINFFFFLKLIESLTTAPVFIFCPVL